MPQLRCIEVITRHASPAATVKLSGPATSVYALEKAVLRLPGLGLLASVLLLAHGSPQRGIS